MLSSSTNIIAVVLGGANTDLVSSGAPPAGPGEMVGARHFAIGPGGKSRNVAQMMGTYLGPGRVSFVCRALAPAADFASLDRLLAPGAAGDVDIMPHVYTLLAQVPLVALERAGVLTDLVTRAPYDGTAGGIAQIMVLGSGENMIYSTAGVNAAFSAEDVARAEPLMEAVAARGGGVVPPAAALAGARLARKHGLRVVIDPGGMTKADQMKGQGGRTLHDVLAECDVVKPNEHEALLLSGVEVTDIDSAERAALALHRRYGMADVVITAGADGAWHWTAGGRISAYPSYPPPEVADTTGCGDQFMAVLSAHLAEGGATDWPSALRHATVASSLQAARPGIQPVAREDVAEHLPRYLQLSDGE